jgi:hypothetical protein
LNVLENQSIITGRQKNTPMQKNIATILALGYSGSHYLSLLLGSHSQSLHIGEVHHLRKAQKPSSLKGVCSLCGGNTACPLFHDLGPHNIDSVYDLIFSRVDPCITTLIDASKTIDWAGRFSTQSKYRMKYIHLIRDPRALIRRWVLTYTSPRQRFHVRWKLARTVPRQAVAMLLSRLHDVYMYNWLLRNQAISKFIRDRELDAYVVTYRDLARDTSGELKKLMDWIGLTYEPTQLEYWNVKHHGTQKSDYEWVKQRKTQYMDLRWQTDLPPTTLQRAATLPAILAYVNELGLTFTTDGLTRLQPQ